MRQELRETTMYNTIIEAIALGNTKLNDIYTKTGITSVSKIRTIQAIFETNLAEVMFERSLDGLPK